MPPLYRALADQLRTLIVTGGLQPGQKLPTEDRLTTEHGVSRNTVRNAVSVLVNEGLVERRGPAIVVREQLSIVFNASDADQVSPHSPSVSDEYMTTVSEQGFTPSQTFEARIVVLPDELAERLNLEPGASAVLRRCIRYVNDKRNSIQDSYHPQWLVDAIPELASPTDIPTGTNRLLADRGYELIAFEDDWRGRPPTPEEATLLDAGRGVSVLVETTTEYSRRGGPTRVTVTTFLGDRNIARYFRGDRDFIDAWKTHQS